MAATAEDDMMPTPFLAATLVSIALPAFAAAAEIPGRAPGLWRTDSVIDGRSMVEMRCIRAGDRESFLKSASKTTCRRTPTGSAGDYVLDTVCPLGGTILKGRLRLKGDFRTQVRGDVVLRHESAHDGGVISISRRTFTSRRVGDCRANDRMRL